jgi:hypothetical protein
MSDRVGRSRRRGVYSGAPVFRGTEIVPTISLLRYSGPQCPGTPEENALGVPVLRRREAARPEIPLRLPLGKWLQHHFTVLTRPQTAVAARSTTDPR